MRKVMRKLHMLKREMSKWRSLSLHVDGRGRNALKPQRSTKHKIFTVIDKNSPNSSAECPKCKKSCDCMYCFNFGE